MSNSNSNSNDNSDAVNVFDDNYSDESTTSRWEHPAWAEDDIESDEYGSVTDDSDADAGVRGARQKSNNGANTSRSKRRKCNGGKVIETGKKKQTKKVALIKWAELFGNLVCYFFFLFGFFSPKVSRIV